LPGASDNVGVVRTDVVPVEPPDVSMYLEQHDKV
jgi:hypothetical protein